jgi:tetratricopeptide (TPR) repeat protein
MQDKRESTNIGDKINDFVQRNRKSIFIILGIFVVLFVATVIFLSLNDYLQNKAIAEVEELNIRFIELTLADDDASGDMDALLADLNSFAKNKRGYAGGKAWSLIGQIQSERKQWAQAEDAWRNAARAGSRTYLAPIAYFNAAAAAEEQGKLEQAIELLGNCIAHPFAFPAVPRAQFTIGRLNEQLNNIPAAMEAYRNVIINWPNWPDTTSWVNLAHSRITALETR